MPAWLNLPNLLTLLRLVLAPFVIRAILRGEPLFALELFAIAAVTDVLDGTAARHFGSSTRGGAYFDPIADKVLMSGVFLALAIGGIVPRWLVVLIFARDIFILLGACVFLIFTSVRSMPPSIWGKLSTLVQIITAVIWMGRDALDMHLLDVLAPLTVWPCAAFTAWSGVDYAFRGNRLWRARIK